MSDNQVEALLELLVKKGVITRVEYYQELVKIDRDAHENGMPQNMGNNTVDDHLAQYRSITDRWVGFLLNDLEELDFPELKSVLEGYYKLLIDRHERGEISFSSVRSYLSPAIGLIRCCLDHGLTLPNEKFDARTARNFSGPGPMRSQPVLDPVGGVGHNG